MRRNILVISSMVLMTLIACDSKERVKAPKPGQSISTQNQSTSNSHEVKVEEVIQAKSYTYLRVTEGRKEYWIATSKQPFEKGMNLSYGQGLEMNDFVSKELDRTFESIWFVGQMSGAGFTTQNTSTGSPNSNPPMMSDQKISVEKVPGGVSVQDLFSDMSAFEGKMVSIRGEVTKFNSRIMDRNWVHIQDGTQAGDYYDLTLTTKASVQVGDVVVFKGVVTLNKDFGAGYKYNLIVEDAVVTRRD